MTPTGATGRLPCVAVAVHGHSPGDHLMAVLADAEHTARLDHADWWPQPDGVRLAVLPPASADRFPRALDTALGRHNTEHPRLRLRVAIHLDRAPAAAVRLVGSRSLHDALDEAPDTNLALLLSDSAAPLYSLPRHSALQPDELHEVVTRDRHAVTGAWLWTPAWTATTLSTSDGRRN
ncbi:hypothetical protein [Actinokineospora sp. NBRC 105648]|uniref:hypothetical protein n=1 Tax=Actinokineospora sp. NBRC 105648 TaxID=3032206 RepID=UPI0024A2B611|nr:hypothetical protein [Actinokineospora sp. NBRC 105648]GLZ38352.1 hypothetical protein Acsp05_19760 [Actinokineospora sp. NBRC 105648]